jgi:hypothetical protein
LSRALDLGGKHVTKVGRNAPCPCGSGKKYKHCCLRSETATRSEALGRDRAWDTMMDKLLDFSRETRFRGDLESAFDLFWNKTYSTEQIDSLDPMQIMSFLDWYVHDYRTAFDSQRIVELFLVEGAPILSEQELELAKAASQSYLSAHEVTDVDEGRTIKLLDAFQNLEHELPHSPSLAGIKVGQLLLGRLVAAGDFRRFSWISMLVPPEVEDEMRAYVAEMFSAYHEEHYQATWEEFLRERGYLFNHFMLNIKGELPTPKIFLPYETEQEGEVRPLVLTPEGPETQDRPAVLVPGQDQGESRPTVLVPGRDD